MVTTSDPKPLQVDASDPAYAGDGEGYDILKEENAELLKDNRRYLARIKTLERKLGALVPKSDFDEATADTGLMVDEESFDGMIELAARDNLRKLLIDHEEVWLHAGLPKSRTVTVGNVSPVTDWMDIEARRVESEDGEIGYVLSVLQSVRR